MASCTHEYFFNSTTTLEEKCYIAQCIGPNCCSENYDVINFFSFVYCYFFGLWYILVPFLLISIFLIFRFISVMVENYLAPSVAYISEWLNFSETLGGVTFLALANGAGDVVTAFVAIESLDGISYNIGALFGSGLFVASFVVAVTILLSPGPIQLEAASIWRDVGIYILASFLILMFAVIGRLTFISGFLMILFYTGLILIVLIQEMINPKKDKPEGLEEENSKTEPLIELKRVDSRSPTTKKFIGLVGKALLKSRSDADKLQSGKEHHSFYNIARYHVYLIKHKIWEEKKESIIEEKNALYYLDTAYGEVWKYTIPACDPENMDRKQCVYFPIISVFLMTFFIFFAPNQGIYFEWWWLLVGVLGGGALTGLFYMTFPLEGEELPKIYILVQILGSIITLIYTDFMCSILIDVLNFLGFVSSLDKTYLGLTIIAIGNALPDAATTMALAKRNMAIMGMTGAYAGQLFGLLIGFGLAIMRKTLQSGSLEFDLISNWERNALDVFVIIVIIIALSYTFVVGVINKYLMTRFLAYSLIAIYGVFFIISTIIAVYNAITKQI